ncbi:hypothetical protein ZYGR_0AI05860 [Zygosaccharomyces rouxii]|uniref:Altered inheritance of mitochondria protein 24, mitochondrial n=1 Tax=Zygosaccharomyces rouxii TaxID=4956 RepID=A0A1Q3AC96_ZYGRO|nr:hypothetical protein ZYGR_0AI05860 [Zygosaccharomyces rouxii]
MISRVLAKSIVRLPTYRCYCSGGVNISDFSTRKKGTGSGPFVELPEFTPLQDSILIKIPSSCTVYGQLDKISAITSDIRDHGKPFLAQDIDSSKGLSIVTTGEHPANILMASHTPLSNVVVLKLANYKQGIYIPNFYQEALCFSGDLHMNDSGELKGLGVVALAGKGPIYQMVLKQGEKNLVARESILAYDSKVRCQLTKLHSSFNIPQSVHEWFINNASKFYDNAKVQWSRLFHSHKIYCELEGPGSVFLQTNFIPGSKPFSKSDLFKASQ